MNLYKIVKTGIEPLNGLDFSQINFSQGKISIWIAGVIFSLILLKLLFSRNQFSQKYSGYFISNRYRLGFMRRMTNATLTVVLACGTGFFIVALAEPFLPVVKATKVVKNSRERIDLIDASSSKGWEFNGTGKAAGQIGREAYLEFLKMRKGHNDRTSLWLFGSDPWIVEDFIMDDDLYMMQAQDAPYVLVGSFHSGLPENDIPDIFTDIVAPRDRIQLIDGEGATNLVGALKAIIKYFDQNSSKDIKQRALLIETDGAVEAYPEEELEELQKRNISIYFLQIKPNEAAEKQYGTYVGIENAKLLREKVKEYGGKFYDVTDRKSILRAYQDIDRLEAVPIETVSVVNKLFLFQMFILSGIIALTWAMIFILIFQIFGVYP